MQTSESIKEITAALIKAKLAFKTVKKDGWNPHFKSKYADLNSGIEATEEALAANGLTVIQPTSESDDGIIVNTLLMHTSGEWIKGELKLKPTKPDPQAAGSCITYARRYALFGMLGIAPEDDDGQEASAPIPMEKLPEKPKQHPTGTDSPDYIGLINRVMVEKKIDANRAKEITGYPSLTGLSMDQLFDAYQRICKAER